MTDHYRALLVWYRDTWQPSAILWSVDLSFSGRFCEAYLLFRVMLCCHLVVGFAKRIYYSGWCFVESFVVVLGHHTDSYIFPLRQRVPVAMRKSAIQLSENHWHQENSVISISVYSSTLRSGGNRYSRGTKGRQRGWGCWQRAASPSSPAREIGERCKLPKRGLGQSPSRNRIWCILAVKPHICWQLF